MNRAITILLITLSVVGLVYLTYRYGFLRKPERNIPNNDSLFVSPANGTIISIRAYNTSSIIETKDTPLTERGAMQLLTSDVAPSGTIITIRLDLTDVHYQRAPTSGIVVNTRYTEGNYHNAITMPGEQQSRYENTHNEILIKVPFGDLGAGAGITYKVVQIAGFVARSIKCKLLPGSAVKQGSIIGSIEIGSQVTIILPAQMQVTAGVGDYVIDGETVLAKIQSV